MKRIILCFLGLLLLPGLSSCGETTAGDSGLSVATSTYPLYLLASAVAEGAEGITITPLVNQSVACLHDYTLTVTDMKLLEGADVVLLNGAGLEAFLDSALVNLPLVDCSQGISLLYDDDGEADPHFWLDPQRAALMVENLAQALAELDPEQGELYLSNGAAYAERLRSLAEDCRRELEQLSCRQLITFHEGFSYLAEAMELEILAAIEEEAGSEASARELVSMVALIQDYGLSAIFTEENGSTATALAIVRECGVELFSLSMLMSGPVEYSSETCYEALYWQNILTLKEALA